MIGDETKCRNRKRRKKLNKRAKVNKNKPKRKWTPNDNNSIKVYVEWYEMEIKIKGDVTSL